ncbi:MAG: hypothetical protein KAU01_02660, partial [Candidatus Cloacimonetes bacterium]|nr:hypothetical protein [Candidatus Cloacimonadota bacterium]
FYNLFACSNSRFTESNNMGGMYLFGNGYCVGTIGSTKTGSMLWFEDFYEPLSLEGTLGEALRQWWEVSVDTGPDWMWERSWFYGMAIQGDPSLKIYYLEGNIVYVPQDYSTIQQAIDAVENGTLVLVDPGTYVENINFNGKNIMVASWFLTTQDTTYITQTIIDGNQNGSVVTFESGEDSTAVLCGFTITNGDAQEGGGICCINNSSPKLCNLVIIDNWADYSGGGMILLDCNSALLDGIKFDSNQSGCFGGNAYISNSHIIINNSIIYHGSAFSYGGGIYCINNSNLDIDNVIFEHNDSSFHGGLYAVDSEVNLSNCIFKGNIGENGGALTVSTSNAVIDNCLFYENGCYNGGNLGFISSNTVVMNSTICNNSAQETNGGISGSNIILINSIIWNNTEPQLSSNTVVNYSNIQGGWEGEGNIDEDPYFINPAIGLFTLSMYSPCLGAGIDEIEINGTWYYVPLFDIEGNPRPNPAGSMPDMGAYESFLGEPQLGIEDCQLSIVDFQLYNYPNPFNPSTTITFNLTTEHTESIELIIYNIKGQKVKSLECGESLFTTAPMYRDYSITWDGTDVNNQSVSSGIYLYKLKSGDYQKINKMILIK